MSTVQNPILKGFNPDPSIIRVGEDYYIATSTFQWYPGVQIHHSKDLKNWRLLTRPLRRDSQLNMLGEFPSCGIWAPCLSYSEGIFYLVYTDVKDNGSPHNYLVTTKDIEGDWSEPIYLNSRGFDASLFHDEDGKKWFLSMEYDHTYWHSCHSFRYGKQMFAKNYIEYKKESKLRGLDSSQFKGIILQAFDLESERLIGPVHRIFKGSEIGITEGPHLYRRNGWYYLLTAEGGTEYGHAVSFARSRDIVGPYELHPKNPILTARGSDGLLQRAGHGDIVDTLDGETYMVHLCSRPIGRTKLKKGTSILGRETALQKMEWREDDWLWHGAENNLPLTQVGLPDLEEVKWPVKRIREDFDTQELPIDFQWLRGDYFDEMASLTARPGYLRLYGGEIIQSYFKQALVARRVQSFKCRIRTSMDFDPKEANQHAGLVVLYNVDMYYYLYKGRKSDGRPYLAIMSNDNGHFKLYEGNEVDISEGKIFLRADINSSKLRFAYATEDQNWVQIGKKLDMTKLSDERAAGGFTGSFVGMACQDPLTHQVHADFDYFDYKELEE